MPFSPNRRLWYLRAWGNGDQSKARCQYRLYSEEKGFYLACKEKGDGLFIVRWTVQKRGTVGIPFCRRHFMELSSQLPFTVESVVYPELAQATRTYHTDKGSFNKLLPYSPSHRTRFGDAGTDVYYLQYGQNVVQRYRLTHPDDKPPSDTMGHHYPSWVEWTEIED